MRTGIHFTVTSGGPSAIASDRRGPEERAETPLAGADHPEDRRGARHFGDHARDRQVQDLRVALAGAVHARGCQRLASRQVPSAWQSADPAGARRRDRPPDPASAAARGDPLDAARDGEGCWRRGGGGPGDLEGPWPQPAPLAALQALQ